MANSPIQKGSVGGCSLLAVLGGGNMKSKISERQEKGHLHCLPSHLTEQALVSLCHFTLGTWTSLCPLLLPRQHGAEVLWVRFLPQCLWFGLAALLRQLSFIPQRKHSHMRDVNLTDSFVVGHLSAVKR